MITIRVEYAFTRRQGARSNGGYHAVLNEALKLGRLERQAGDALCKPRAQFWGLEKTPNCTHVTCPRCTAVATRAGITIPTA